MKKSNLHSVPQTGNLHFEHVLRVVSTTSLFSTTSFFSIDFHVGFRHPKHTAGDLLFGPQMAGISSKMISPARISLVAIMILPTDGKVSIRNGQQTRLESLSVGIPFALLVDEHLLISSLVSTGFASGHFCFRVDRDGHRCTDRCSLQQE